MLCCNLINFCFDLWFIHYKWIIVWNRGCTSVKPKLWVFIKFSVISNRKKSWKQSWQKKKRLWLKLKWMSVFKIWDNLTLTINVKLLNSKNYATVTLLLHIKCNVMEYVICIIKLPKTTSTLQLFATQYC